MTTWRGGMTTLPQDSVYAGHHPDMRVPPPQTGRNRVLAGQRVAYRRTNIAYQPLTWENGWWYGESVPPMPKPQVSSSYHRTPYGVASSWYAATPGGEGAVQGAGPAGC
jgi:hypothetical protein